MFAMKISLIVDVFWKAQCIKPVLQSGDLRPAYIADSPLDGTCPGFFPSPVSQKA